jgi:hypothetical protein
MDLTGLVAAGRTNGRVRTPGGAEAGLIVRPSVFSNR